MRVRHFYQGNAALDDDGDGDAVCPQRLNRGKQNPPTPPTFAAIQFHAPTDPNETAGSLLHNSFGFDVPMDSHWLSCFFVADPSAILNGRIKNVPAGRPEKSTARRWTY